MFMGLFSGFEPISWIIVFLGNPGPRYEKTRHNAGFMTADAIEKTTGVKMKRVRFTSLVSLATIGGQRVLLMKPQAYMNRSGDAVRAAMRYYKAPLGNVVVVSDDVSLSAGKLRIKRSGSAGGHNGLKDIIAKCGSEGFPRIKIGVGAPPDENYDIADWVLSKPVGEDCRLITEAVSRAAVALETIIAHGVDAAMVEFN